MLAPVAAFAASIASHVIACEWQAARERGQLWKIAVVTTVGEVFDWAPLAIAFMITNDPAVIGASIAGAVVGSVWGTARERRRRVPYIDHGRESRGTIVYVDPERESRGTIASADPEREPQNADTVPDRDVDHTFRRYRDA
jgi:hypothetical protein